MTLDEQLDRSSAPGVTGDTLYEARFDPGIAKHGRIVGTLILAATVVGIPFIPFLLLLSLWYYPAYFRRISARLTTQAVEIRKGVFFRTEATIPLNRITDVRLHDGPVMRYCNVRGLRVETAGQSGTNAGAEGDIIGVVGAEEMRNAILSQRQRVLGADQAAEPARGASAEADILTEIRDILARIEAKWPPS
jgi:putative membrane protein